MKTKPITIQTRCKLHTYVLHKKYVTDGYYRVSRAVLKKLFQLRQKRDRQNFISTLSTNHSSASTFFASFRNNGATLGCRFFSRGQIRIIQDWAMADTIPKLKRKSKT